MVEWMGEERYGDNGHHQQELELADYNIYIALLDTGGVEKCPI